MLRLHKKAFGKTLRYGVSLALMTGLISACGGGGGGGSSAATTTTSGGSGGNSSAPVTGVQTPGSVAVVTAQNAG